MNTETYETPTITDFGSLEELTAICDFPGAGDQDFPGELDHNVVAFDSQGLTCISL